MDDVIMERIVKDIEEAAVTGDKLAGALLEVLALIMKWKNEGKGHFTHVKAGVPLISKLDAGEQVLSAIEKGMT